MAKRKSAASSRPAGGPPLQATFEALNRDDDDLDFIVSIAVPLAQDTLMRGVVQGADGPPVYGVQSDYEAGEAGPFDLHYAPWSPFPAATRSGWVVATSLATGEVLWVSPPLPCA